MSDNRDKDLPPEGMKAKASRKFHVSSFAWTTEILSTIKVLFISYFVSNPESEPEPESITSPEPESEQPHHDSAPLFHGI